MIIGLGNPDLADDGAGILVASQLKAFLKNPVYIETEKCVESLVVRALDDPSIHIFCFIDAVDFSEKPGSWRFFTHEDINQFLLPVSSHQVPFHILADLILQKNKTFTLLGIQPKTLEWMKPPSFEITETIDRVLSFFKSLK